ncbi:MAG: ATP-binding protein [Aquificae bacterium]|nr:ATP-binding protein [Aquificota bacterium]
MGELLERAVQLSLLKTGQEIPTYKRFLYPQLEKSPSSIIGIYGARGVGKTTLMLQWLKSMPFTINEAIYISCDHPIFVDLDLFGFLEEFYKMGGKVIFIDEIHKVKDFQKHLKSAYDFLKLKIVFSGSSAVRITNPDLVRRFSMYKLPILSLREYIEMLYGIKLESYTLEEIIKNHQIIAESVVKALGDVKILAVFQDYNIHGAYPFYFEDRGLFIDKLQDTVNAVLYYDLAELYNISPEKIHTIKKLLATICVSKPLELSIERLAGITGISKITLYRYLDYLSRGELILHITHEAKRFKSVRKPDKLYLANTNLFHALCLKPDKGSIRETFFASMLNYRHRLHYLDTGDFLVDERYIFEVGGKGKSFSQIKDRENSFLAVDGIEIGLGRKIPLWLFGFLY